MCRGVEFVKIISDYITNPKGFNQCLKSLKLLSAGNGCCKVELTVANEHLNSWGSLHGGFTATLVDTISTYALMTYKDGIRGVSVDIHVSYLMAAFPGDVVTIDARTVRAGRTLAFLDVELKKKDSGAIIARGQHIKYIGSS